MPKKTAGPSASTKSARPRAPRKPASNGNASDGNGAAPSFDQIAEAAYHRFLQRGGSHGDDVNDWVEAERELRLAQVGIERRPEPDREKI